jgi:hypothetical protein
MSLTTISDISILYQQIAELQELLEQKIATSDQHIGQLETAVYKHFILSLEDKDWSIVRKKRNYLLKISDWTMTAGCTVNQHDWAVYRQQLRDIPQTYQAEKLEDIEWPEMPSPLGPNTAAEDLIEPEPALEFESEITEESETVVETAESTVEEPPTVAEEHVATVEVTGPDIEEHADTTTEEVVTVEETHTAPSSSSSSSASETSFLEITPASTELPSADVSPTEAALGAPLLVDPEVESTEETPTNTEPPEEE